MSHRPGTRVVALLLAVPLAGVAGVLAGCGTGGAGRPAVGSAAGTPTGTPAPTCLPAPASLPSGTRGEEDGGRAVPDVALRCFAGGRAARTGDLRGPVLVNLWSSSCAPCRSELPALQRFADRAAGRVGVVGVVTADRRTAAQSVIDDLGLTFGMLDDPAGALLRALGRVALPVTLLVTADGRVAYTHVGPALDEAAADRLARRHLGVGALS